jgi:hypothetical protein
MNITNPSGIITNNSWNGIASSTSPPCVESRECLLWILSLTITVNLAWGDLAWLLLELRKLAASLFALVNPNAALHPPFSTTEIGVNPPNNRANNSASIPYASDAVIIQGIISDWNDMVKFSDANWKSIKYVIENAAIGVRNI